MQDNSTILLPIRVLEGESVPEGVPELLENAHVVLLGYHVVPDQTATDQARDQFEDQATRRLDDLAAILEDADQRSNPDSCSPTTASRRSTG